MRQFKDIIDAEREINRVLVKHGYSHSIQVADAGHDYSFFKRPLYRIYLADENKMQAERYFLAARRETVNWLTAYYKGLCMGLMEEESYEHD